MAPYVQAPTERHFSRAAFMPQSFASLHCHFVFSTKHREPLIHDELESKLYAYIGGILEKQECRLIAAGGMPDHVHLLVSLSRKLSVAVALRMIKSNSSKWIHEEFPGMSQFRWQDDYGAFAVSYSGINAVKEYFAKQKEHHRKFSFQEEFLELLRRHHLEWDERYVWD